jgi:hypothetical protein
MTKTNDTWRVAALEDHRPLADSELDAVSGGTRATPARQPSTLPSESVSLEYGGIIFSYSYQRAD